VKNPLPLSSLAPDLGRSPHLDLYSAKLETTRAPQFVDVTDIVQGFVSQTHPRLGMALVFSRHTTAAIRINENEPLLIRDMEEFLERIAPRHHSYHHNDFSVRTVNIEEDECPNGHAHCQHLLLSTSETIPILNGELQLGRWQRVFLVELDRPRERELLIQVIGF